MCPKGRGGAAEEVRGCRGVGVSRRSYGVVGAPGCRGCRKV